MKSRLNIEIDEMSIINSEAREIRRIQLSLAVSLMDKYSGGSPLGEVNLFLDGNKRPIPNNSGYYAFINLPDGIYNINVVSENYLDEKVGVEIEQAKLELAEIRQAKTDQVKIMGNKYPFLEITLIPKPSYPFPPGETLVRGTLRDSKGPVSGAQLEVNLHTKFSTRTDEKGEFVIYFGSLNEEEDESKEIKVECRIGNNLMEIKNQLSYVTLGTTKSWNPVLTSLSVHSI